jgi:lysophospholipase L1-like esterase
MSRSIVWIRRAGIWTIYAALAAITLEGAARMEDYWKDGAPLTAAYTINTIFQPSPFGRAGKPRASFGKWHMNSLGFRGPELHEGTHRILAFGASETFGIYEKANGEYPRLIEQMLNANSPGKYEVVNIALPGMRIGRVAYLEDAIRRTSARTVLIYPTPANYIGTTQPYCGEVNTPVPNESGLGERLRVVGRIDRLSKRHLPEKLMDGMRRVAIAREERHVEVMTRVPDASIQAFRTDLACAVRAAQSLGARVVLATHGNYFGVKLQPQDLPMMRSWRRFYVELAEEGFIDLEGRANEAVRDLAREQGLDLVDVAAAIPPGPENFADFVHFNDNGARVIADLVTKRLLGGLTSAREPTAASAASSTR